MNGLNVDLELDTTSTIVEDASSVLVALFWSHLWH